MLQLNGNANGYHLAPAALVAPPARGLSDDEAPEPPRATGQYPDAVWAAPIAQAARWAAAYESDDDVPAPLSATGQYPDPVWVDGRAVSAGLEAAEGSSLALKEADYAEQLDEIEDPPRVERAAAAQLIHAEMYRIIREVARADSGDAAYAAVLTDEAYEAGNAASPTLHGLSFGLVLFTQASGRLGSVLQLMKKRDAALFAEIFGPSAEALLAVTNAPTVAERLAPVAGEALSGTAWLACFRRAGQSEIFQAAQNKEAIEGQFRPMWRIVRELGMTTDRALACCYDRVVTQGLAGGLRWIVQRAGPLRTSAQRQHALQMLGYGEVAQFQTATGWLVADGRFTHATHAALVGALRRQSSAALPSPAALSWQLYAAATGTAKTRLRRLLDAASFTDLEYQLD